MGFLLFLNLVARICDVFAWPLITLVYPLYASIRAIERNSLSDCKKCLTYWIISGLIMLSEMPFAGIVHWIPFWPYAKLMFNCWFVAAHFKGAVYVFDHFIRPCFSVNVKTFGHWLRRLGAKHNQFGTGNSNTILLLAKRFVQENGSDGLEKLISDKVKCEEPNLALGENDSVHSGHIKENTDTHRVEMSEAGLVQSSHKATEEANVVAESSGVAQSSIPSSNTQMEWTCALCQVCVSSEITLQNHLKGRKHKAKLEMVKNRAKQNTAKTLKEQKPPLAKPIAERNPTVRTELASGISEPSILGQPPKKWKCTLCQIYTSKESLMQNHIQGKRHKEKEMEVLAKQLEDIKNTVSVSSSTAPTVNLSDLWCHKCKLQCNSLSMLTDHLRGKRHLEGIKEEAA